MGRASQVWQAEPGEIHVKQETRIVAMLRLI